MVKADADFPESDLAETPETGWDERGATRCGTRVLVPSFAQVLHLMIVCLVKVLARLIQGTQLPPSISLHKVGDIES